LVEESDYLDLTSAEDRARQLSSVLGQDNIGLVHGKMSGEEKDKVMSNFIRNKIKILVATTVIEVGVDVPNASIIVIEHSERFGLSQLHQLRGRVGRGIDTSTCLLVYASPLGKTAKKRLETIRETNDGFKIANVDLKLRGAGDILGVAQSGLPKFRMADIETQSDLMELAKDEARLILNNDPSLLTEKGKALRNLLFIMGADQYIKMLSVG
jgi:ATP-dependent DNA helicase RecG